MAEKTESQTRELLSELSVRVAESVKTSEAFAVYAQRDIGRLDGHFANMNDALYDLSNRIAVLEQKVDDLRSGWREASKILWAIVGPLIGAGIVYYLGWKK